MSRCVQIDYYCRLDCLWKNKFKKEHEEFETMENVNRLLLENVLPAHVAAHFIGDKLNEVRAGRGSVTLGEAGTEVQRPAGLRRGFYLQNVLRGSWPDPCAPDSGGFGVRQPGGHESSLPWAWVFTCVSWGPQYLPGRIAARVKCTSGICHRTTSGRTCMFPPVLLVEGTGPVV